MNAKEVDFCKFLTGHDDETIIELYTKWERNRDKRSGQFEQQVREKFADEVGGKYHELLYAVERKHPNETRHQTALRYIKEAEKNRHIGDVDTASKFSA